MNNSVYLVVNNPDSTAIKTTGTGGNIISESETNIVKWNVGTYYGKYIIPFSKSSGNKIPLELKISSAGIGSGSILFSTYGGATWDNSAYLPSDVTNISSLTGGINNSANVIDRFWIIDAVNYTTKPSPAITFNYLDSEHSAVGNTISEPTLFAQRFNNTINDWGGWLGTFGTVNTTANTVFSGTLSPADFFRSWTLVNQNSILPIELLYFKTECQSNNVINFQWATATEINNSFFTIEKSTNGVTWQELHRTKGAGNSSSTINYNYTSFYETDYNYFRLKQTDLNGAFKYSQIVSELCSNNNQPLFSFYPNPSTGQVNILLSNIQNQNVSIEITNALGQLVAKRNLTANENQLTETINIETKTKGIYFITVTTNSKQFTDKIIIYE
ncbi:MAG: T9SS type A sorting domain-containing protein [Bacteroidia bacterium]|nr:T9SS type A sorting domain-containing protein [Bacteroidia bacterium]